MSRSNGTVHTNIIRTGEPGIVADDGGAFVAKVPFGASVFASDAPRAYLYTTLSLCQRGTHPSQYSGPAVSLRYMTTLPTANTALQPHRTQQSRPTRDTYPHLRRCRAPNRSDSRTHGARQCQGDNRALQTPSGRKGTKPQRLLHGTQHDQQTTSTRQRGRLRYQSRPQRDHRRRAAPRISEQREDQD